MQQFDQNGNPIVTQHQPPVNNSQQPDPNQLIQMLAQQQQQMQAQMAQMMGAFQQIQQPQQQQPTLQAPEKPSDFNPHDMFDPSTPTGKWYQENQEYERKKLLQDVGSVVKDEIGTVQQQTEFRNKVNQFAQANQMDPNTAQQFEEFLNNPKADMNVLYEVFKQKQQPPVNANAPTNQNTEEGQQYTQNIPTPQNVMQQKGIEAKQTGENMLVQDQQNLPPAPVSSVGAQNPNGETPPPTFSEMAKQIGGVY